MAAGDPLYLVSESVANNTDVEFTPGVGEQWLVTNVYGSHMNGTYGTPAYEVHLKDSAGTKMIVCGSNSDAPRRRDQSFAILLDEDLTLVVRNKAGATSDISIHGRIAGDARTQAIPAAVGYNAGVASGATAYETPGTGEAWLVNHFAAQGRVGTLGTADEGPDVQIRLSDGVVGDVTFRIGFSTMAMSRPLRIIADEDHSIGIYNDDSVAADLVFTGLEIDPADAYIWMGDIAASSTQNFNPGTGEVLTLLDFGAENWDSPTLATAYADCDVGVRDDGDAGDCRIYQGATATDETARTHMNVSIDEDAQFYLYNTQGSAYAFAIAAFDPTVDLGADAGAPWFVHLSHASGSKVQLFSPGTGEAVVVQGMACSQMSVLSGFAGPDVHVYIDHAIGSEEAFVRHADHFNWSHPWQLYLDEDHELNVDPVATSGDICCWGVEVPATGDGAPYVHLNAVAAATAETVVLGTGEAIIITREFASNQGGSDPRKGLNMALALYNAGGSLETIRFTEAQAWYRRWRALRVFATEDEQPQVINTTGAERNIGFTGFEVDPTKFLNVIDNVADNASLTHVFGTGEKATLIDFGIHTNGWSGTVPNKMMDMDVGVRDTGGSEEIYVYEYRIGAYQQFYNDHRVPMDEDMEVFLTNRSGAARDLGMCLMLDSEF